MKTRLINFSLVLAFIFGAFASNMFGQTAASVTWLLDQADTTMPNPIVGNLTAQPLAGSDSFSIASINSKTFTGTGPIPGYQNIMAWWPGKDALGNKIMWGAETAQVDYRYIQFVVSPKTGNTFIVDTISIWLSGGGTSMEKVNLYYSTDPLFIVNSLINTDSGATGISLPNSGSTTVNGILYIKYVVNVTVNDGQSLYFRVYPWYTGPLSNSKYLFTQDAYISGTTSPVTAIKETSNLPKVYSLSQNYPNPFNPSTQISFNLEKSGMTELTVYNLLGQKVASLINSILSSGEHNVTFNASNLPSGMYLYKLTSGSYSITKKMVLLK